MECTPGAVRAGAKFEETREVVEEALTMRLWNGVFAT